MSDRISNVSERYSTDSVSRTGSQTTTIPFTFNAEKDSEVVYQVARFKI